MLFVREMSVKFVLKIVLDHELAYNVDLYVYRQQGKWDQGYWTAKWTWSTL